MGVPAVLLGLLATAGCGRIGFDESGGPGTVLANGCGLRSLVVGGHVSCAVTATGAVMCWGEHAGIEPTRISVGGVATKVVAGHHHFCVLLETGRVRCFGNNGAGQHGNGTIEPGEGPSIPVGDSTYTDLAATRSGTCAVRSTGTVECWGEGVGVESSLVPTPIGPPGVRFERLIRGKVSMCAESADRRFCWGNVPFLDGGIESSPPIEVPRTGEVAMTRKSGCVLVDGRVRCMGYGESGTLGDGSIDSIEETGNDVGLSDIVSIAGGSRIQCAVGATGDLSCWGANRSGDLGVGDVTFRTSPTRVELPATARVSLIHGHACAETIDGVYCWGANAKGETGRGVRDSIDTPVPIAGLPGMLEQIGSSGRAGSGCARTTTGEVWCWGQNASGITGDPSRQSSPTASQIQLPFAAEDLTVGSGFACAGTTNQAMCWGTNSHGQLGGGTSEAFSATPVAVALATPISSLVASGSGACAIAAGQQTCWGLRLDPSQALPAITRQTRPPSDTGSHGCVLDTAGTAICWGANNYGELGRGFTGNGDPTPTAVVGGRVYTEIAAIPYYNAITCAVTNGSPQELDCWGHYDGASMPSPTPMTLSAEPVGVEAGGGMLCARFADDSRECVGFGYYGDGTSGGTNTFSRIATPMTAVAYDDQSPCFIALDGIGRCAGQERHGTHGAAPSTAMPMRVPLSCE